MWKANWRLGTISKVSTHLEIDALFVVSAMSTAKIDCCPTQSKRPTRKSILWKSAVEKAESFEVDAIRDAFSSDIEFSCSRRQAQTRPQDLSRLQAVPNRACPRRWSVRHCLRVACFDSARSLPQRGVPGLELRLDSRWDHTRRTSSHLSTEERRR